MFLDRKRTLKVGLTGLLIAAILAVSLSHRALMISAYLSLALACALIVYAVIRRAWLDFAWVLAGGLFLAVLDYRVTHFEPIFMAACAFVSLATLSVLGAHIIWAESEDRKMCEIGRAHV